MKRLIASLAAAGVLVAGAFVVVSVISSPADAQVGPTVTDEGTRPGDGLLEEVLAGLVEDGVITQSQSDEVKVAFEDKREEIKAEREARREQRKEQRELIQGFLEDDVIDADELAQLPEDHPWFADDSPLAEALEDGELTKEELRDAAPGHTHRHRHPHRGHGGAEADEATANT